MKVIRRSEARYESEGGVFTATDPRLFQAPWRAGIQVLADQLEPLRKVLLLPRVNLFIADHAGLGKTIEAGLIARELMPRVRPGLPARALVRREPVEHAHALHPLARAAARRGVRGAPARPAGGVLIRGDVAIYANVIAVIYVAPSTDSTWWWRSSRASMPGLTRVTYRFNFSTRPRWLRPLLDLVAAALFAREVRQRLKALKRHLEASRRDSRNLER